MDNTTTSSKQRNTMPLLSHLLFKATAFCRCRIINGPNQSPYLERYHLFRLPFGYHAYLHRFVASDPGRGLHNHPWNRAVSLVLSGEYEEVRMANALGNHELMTRRIGAGHLNWIGGSAFHRINLIGNREVWTLFVHGPKTKSWGFLRKQQHRYAFHDHDRLLQQMSYPLWWKTASKPIDCPAMRKSTDAPGTTCMPTLSG